MIGRTISHYKITEKLGEGGMGVVYKAEDTKLERTVALKFLAAHLLNDDEAKARFLREAKAAAGLNHPNICPVYEIGEAEGKTFLSMAFIEGEPLEPRIERGPLPLKDALDIGRQIADGLQAAHEKGVVHRDIKPANVMVDAKGRATIMDFGLARLTEASRLTKTDQTMGTVAYMSPEQAQGMEVDHRSDVWALGVVLYEMVRGQRPFQGEYDQALLFEIVHQQPEPLTGVRAGVPMELELIVGKCLAKGVEDRYGHADEIAKDLRALGEKLKSGRSTTLRTTDRAAGSPTTTSASQTESPARTWLWPAVAAVLAIVAVALAFIAVRGQPGPATTRLSIPLPPGQEITSSPAISGDGQIIAYTAQQGTDAPQLYLRHLDSFEARAVAGSSGAQQPFFSPDGKWVAFFAQGHLQKAEVARGTPILLAEAALPFGGTWNQDDTIIYAASLGSGLLRIPASGGTPEVLTKPDGAAAGYAHGFPQALPGGRSVLFTIEGQTQGGAVLSLDSGQWELVVLGEFCLRPRGRPRFSTPVAVLRAACWSSTRPPTSKLRLSTPRIPRTPVPIVRSWPTCTTTWRSAEAGLLSRTPAPRSTRPATRQSHRWCGSTTTAQPNR